jgi:predicted site-specific integrase-resolvase
MPTTGSSSSEAARRPPGAKPRVFAAREGIDLATLRQWVAKGLVERARLAPRTGVRVRYRDEDAE